MSDPSRPPRKFTLDPPPMWPGAREVIDRADALNLHPEQKAAIAKLLSMVRDNDLAAPGLIAHGHGPTDAVILMWVREDRGLRVSLCPGLRTRLTYYRDGHRVADETPKHPANLLRVMLATVFPRSLDGGRYDRP